MLTVHWWYDRAMRHRRWMPLEFYFYAWGEQTTIKEWLIYWLAALHLRLIILVIGKRTIIANTRIVISRKGDIRFAAATVISFIGDSGVELDGKYELFTESDCSRQPLRAT